MGTSLARLMILALPVLAACGALLPSAPSDDEVLDGPIEGLSAAQLAVFAEGDEEFNRTFGAEEGAGPMFVASACGSCHVGDGKGHPVFNLTRFGRMVEGVFDPMRALGGPQVQNRAVQQYVAEVVPAGVTGVAVFTAPAVTGLGLLESVDDTTLLRMADPDDLDGDGMSGRVQLLDEDDLIVQVTSLDAVADESGPTRGVPIGGKYIGRFGKKGVTVNLLHQTVTAYHQDMGLTTDLVLEDLFNRQVGTFASDDVADPEVGSSTVTAVVFYLKTLRPPPRRNASDPAVVAGEAHFAAAGCARCHVPTLRSGASPIGPLNGAEFHPYTDLLLHDMGPELDDGYTEGIAATSEWRTAPLWGVGLAAGSQGGRMHLLHDGRAGSFRDAIELHGGEASASRAAFRALTTEQQEELFRFLESL
ncbi:MAG TPA: di-heme oxidoredictase family protein [Gemmatimonadales bacterium]|nr:di-heme oxidoredictase family protein [Gemmatimonadales bacterium]